MCVRACARVCVRERACVRLCVCGGGGESAHVCTHLWSLAVQLTTIITLPDANECDEGSDSCDMNADCVNTQGSYTCTCKAGYSGDGIYCTSKHCRFIVFVNVSTFTYYFNHARQSTVNMQLHLFQSSYNGGSGPLVRASHCLLRELSFDAEVGEVLKCK